MRTADPAEAPDGSFRLGDAYCYPNPGAAPTAHVEAGLADGVDLRLYDSAGGLVRELALSGPRVVDGRWAFERRVDGLASGVYAAVAAVRKSGRPNFEARFKCAVLK